jgi:hypothetical protein
MRRAFRVDPNAEVDFTRIALDIEALFIQIEAPGPMTRRRRFRSPASFPAGDFLPSPS